ncbi:hypothetical protein ACLOAV_008346 [Pseudogymnoascus australis]
MPEDDFWRTGERANRLFFTNADGGEESDPDEAIYEALDGEWVRLEPEAAELLGDESAGPYERYLALCALACWASPTGYEAVCRAAANPNAQPSMSMDRFYSLDNTFAVIAKTVLNSERIAKERCTSSERLTALAALIGIVDQVYFEQKLSRYYLFEEDIEQLRRPIEAKLESYLGELLAAQAPLLRFVHDQIDVLINALETVDKDAADAYTARLNNIRGVKLASTSEGTT